MITVTVTVSQPGNGIGQLLEHNKRNIFLQKSCRKLGREREILLKVIHEAKTRSLLLRFNIIG